MEENMQYFFCLKEKKLRAIQSQVIKNAKASSTWSKIIELLPPNSELN